MIGVGGFGIVYLAHDDLLCRTVAVKEYLPITIAGRMSDGEIRVRSLHFSDTYQKGLQSFMREARLQARFSHPAMLEVYQVWEQRGTAYMAMRYYAGESLFDLRQDATSSIGFNEDAIRRIMSPVFDGIEVLHAQSVLHRDVSPDNILIMPSGVPMLLDFGAARMVVAGTDQSLTTVLKPDYAPVEQYIDDGTMVQGPWTDVYALGAVLYFLAMGTPPPPAVSRMVVDALNDFEASAQGRFSKSFISAVVASLAVQPTRRLQTVAALRDALGWPDEPVVEAPKSILITTMEVPFNAEWRAAQMAQRDAPAAAPVTSVATDAVTVLLANPMAHIDAAIVAASSVVLPDASSPYSAQPNDTEVVQRTPTTSGTTERRSTTGFVHTIRTRWAIAASLLGAATLVLFAQAQRPSSDPVTGAAETMPTERGPLLQFTTTIRDLESNSAMRRADAALSAEHAGAAVEDATVAPSSQPRTKSPRKRPDEAKAEASALPTAALVDRVAPAAAIGPPPSPAPARKRSAACERMISKLSPSEASMAQSETGAASDCR